MMKLMTDPANLKPKRSDLRKSPIDDDCDKDFTECVKDLLEEIKNNWDQVDHKIKFTISKEDLLKGICDWHLDITIEESTDSLGNHSILSIIEIKNWIYNPKGSGTFDTHMARAFTELYDIKYNVEDKSIYNNTKFFCICRHTPDLGGIQGKNYKNLFNSIDVKLYNWLEKEEFKKDIVNHLNEIESTLNKIER